MMGIMCSLVGLAQNPGLPFERVAAHIHEPSAEPEEKLRPWVGVADHYGTSVRPYASGRLRFLPKRVYPKSC
jgi:hypothetical protein